MLFLKSDYYIDPTEVNTRKKKPNLFHSASDDSKHTYLDINTVGTLSMKLNRYISNASRI